MAYFKLKEITKYFNFNKQLDVKVLPKYVNDYVYDDEIVLAAYATKRDKGIFTNKRMILFDVTPFTKQKKIHIIPYYSISTSTILFDSDNGAILISLDSGYQMRLNFVKLKAEDKTFLRRLYMDIVINSNK